jgi:hypothetical protein
MAWVDVREPGFSKSAGVHTLAIRFRIGNVVNGRAIIYLWRRIASIA